MSDKICLTEVYKSDWGTWYIYDSMNLLPQSRHDNVMNALNNDAINMTKQDAIDFCDFGIRELTLAIAATHEGRIKDAIKHQQAALDQERLRKWIHSQDVNEKVLLDFILNYSVVELADGEKEDAAEQSDYWYKIKAKRIEDCFDEKKTLSQIAWTAIKGQSNISSADLLNYMKERAKGERELRGILKLSISETI